MKNLFSIGTDKFKKNALKGSIESVMSYFKELVTIAPDLDINNILFYANDNNGLAETPNRHYQLNIEHISGLSVNELLDLAISACEPYITPINSKCVFSYPPFNEECIDADYHRFVSSFDGIFEAKTDDKIYLYSKKTFDQSVKVFLLMSALYSCSVLESEQDIPNSKRLLFLGFPQDKCQKLCKELSKSISTANQKAYDGKTNPLSGFIKFNCLFNNPIFSERYYNKPYNKIKVKGDFFSHKETGNFKLESFYDYIICRGLSDIRIDKAGTIKEVDAQPSSKERLISFINNFSFKDKAIMDTFLNDLPNRLITEYEIERLTNINLIYHYTAGKLIADKGLAFNLYETNVLSDTFISFINGSLDPLLFYPLVRLRLSILDIFFLQDVSKCEEILKLLKHQTNYYFPIIDCLFHLLLVIKYSGNNTTPSTASNLHLNKSDLTNQLKDLYSNFTYYAKNNFPYKYNNDDIKVMPGFLVDKNVPKRYLFEYDKGMLRPITLPEVPLNTDNAELGISGMLIEMELEKLENIISNFNPFSDLYTTKALVNLSDQICRNIKQQMKNLTMDEQSIYKMVSQRHDNTCEILKIVFPKKPCFDGGSITDEEESDYYRKYLDKVERFISNAKCAAKNYKYSQKLSYLKNLKTLIEKEIYTIENERYTVILALELLKRLYFVNMPEYFRSVFNKDILL